MGLNGNYGGNPSEVVFGRQPTAVHIVLPLWGAVSKHLEDPRLDVTKVSSVSSVLLSKVPLQKLHTSREPKLNIYFLCLSLSVDLILND